LYAISIGSVYLEIQNIKNNFAYSAIISTSWVFIYFSLDPEGLRQQAIFGTLCPWVMIGMFLTALRNDEPSTPEGRKYKTDKYYSLKNYLSLFY